eukprot:Nk52_evm47s151 gene=Nk52_evmTU47s151
MFDFFGKKKAKAKANEPKNDPSCPLAVFYYADKQFQSVMDDLKKVDRDNDNDTYQALVESVHKYRAKLLRVVETIFADLNECDLLDREYRLKFPEDVQDELSSDGAFFAPLLFGAECISNGAVIEGRQRATGEMKPVADQLVAAFATLRKLLKKQALVDPHFYSSTIRTALKHFDSCWTAFENLYVRCIVPVKNSRDAEMSQEMSVLLSEAMIHGLKKKFITQDMIDDYEPSVMFTIPRLAVLSGLLFGVDSEKSHDFCLSKFAPSMEEIPVIKSKLSRLNSVDIRDLECRLAQKEQQMAPLKRRKTVEDLYLDIASISDGIQSCEHSKEFREVLKSTFFLYTQHPLADAELNAKEEDKDGNPVEERGNEEAFRAFRRLSHSYAHENSLGEQALHREMSVVRENSGDS